MNLVILFAFLSFDSKIDLLLGNLKIGQIVAEIEHCKDKKKTFLISLAFSTNDILATIRPILNVK